MGALPPRPSGAPPEVFFQDEGYEGARVAEGMDAVHAGG